MTTSNVQRRRTKPNEPADQGILDEQEQEQIIERFERDLARHAQQTKVVVAASAASLAGLYLGLALLQVVNPWTMSHQAVFQGTVAAGSVAVADLGAVISALLAAQAVWVANTGKDWRKPLRLSGTMSLFILGFWGTALFQVAATVKVSALWKVVWRPVTPLAVTLATASAIDSLLELTPRLEALKTSQYQMKRA